MAAWTVAILAVAAFLTSLLSGIIGMGGGMLLLAVMLSVLPHAQAIPLHAAVQLVSNAARLAAFRGSIQWPTALRFAAGALPGVALSTLTLWAIGRMERGEPYVKLLIGIYILTLTILPAPVGGGRKERWHDFLLLGVAAGYLGLLVGGIGPLVAPMFVRRHFVKEKLLATDALCVMWIHLLKLPAFALLGRIDPAPFSGALLLMSLAVIPGAFIGRRVLRHVTPQTFVLLYRIALTLAGFKILILDGVRPLLATHPPVLP